MLGSALRNLSELGSRLVIPLSHVAGAMMVVLTIAACGSDSLPVDPDPSSSVPINAGGQANPDQAWAELSATSLPGFAGWWLDDDGVPTVALSSRSHESSAVSYVESIRTIAHPETGVPHQLGRSDAPVRIQDVAYSYADLWGFLQSAFDALDGADEMSGISYVTIDKIHNLIRIGVRSYQYVSQVREMMTSV